MINNALFLYNYFKALENSVHMHPSIVKHKGRDYNFYESRKVNDYDFTSYKFDDDIQIVLIPNEDLKIIINDIALKEHLKIAENLKQVK